jgi:hypothetical protein
MASTKWYVHPVIATGVIINVFLLGLAVFWSHDNARGDCWWKTASSNGCSSCASPCCLACWASWR